MTRDELIEAGAQALYGPDEEGDSLEARQLREGCRSLAEEALDAMLPLITAAIAEAIENVAFEVFDDTDGYKSIRVHPLQDGLTEAVKIVRDWRVNE